MRRWSDACSRDVERRHGGAERALQDLAAFVGIAEANLSLLKGGKVKGARFETLERICAYLRRQPGDLLRVEPDPEA